MKEKMNNVYQFKIILKDIKPEIWRRIQVPDTYTFWDLHCAIQDVMEWSDSQLHEFVMNEKDSESIYIIALPDDEMIYDALNEREEKISDHIKKEKQEFEYLYDFEDGWEHLVVLEKILPADNKKEYPVCLDGKRSSPPENSGGPWEYEDILEALKNKNHEEHGEVVSWLGKDYDPEDFEAADILFRDPEAMWRDR